MDKKLMLFFAFLLSGLITTLAVEYFLSGKFNLAYLLGILLGSLLGWIILSSSGRPWIFRVGMAFGVLFVPGGWVGFIRFLASLFSIQLPVWSIVVLYLLGVFVMLIFFMRSTSRSGEGRPIHLPLVDERQAAHFSLSGYWAFLFLNLLIIGALLQPWVPRGQVGLWIVILIAGLVFWGAFQLVLDLKR
jgi:hypothetical protein